MTDFVLVLELECSWDVRATGGEGPLWIEAEQSLYFVDIDGQKLHCYEETSNARRSLELEEKTGWVLPRCNHNDFVAGCESGVYFMDKSSGKMTFAMNPEPLHVEYRLNEGKCVR